jgi:hypothetical protein
MRTRFRSIRHLHCDGQVPDAEQSGIPHHLSTLSSRRRTTPQSRGVMHARAKIDEIEGRGVGLFLLAVRDSYLRA